MLCKTQRQAGQKRWKVFCRLFFEMQYPTLVSQVYSRRYCPRLMVMLATYSNLTEISSLNTYLGSRFQFFSIFQWKISTHGIDWFEQFKVSNNWTKSRHTLSTKLSTEITCALRVRMRIRMRVHLSHHLFSTRRVPLVHPLFFADDCSPSNSLQDNDRIHTESGLLLRFSVDVFGLDILFEFSLK